MVRILLIEDERPVRELTKVKLKNKYEILEAEDGVKAFDVLEHDHADLIIVDVMMPNMDGYEFVSELRAMGDDIPVIMLTAMDTFAHKKKGYNLGIDEYLTKPIDYEELTWHIEAILRRYKINCEKEIVIGNFRISEETMSVTIDEKNVDLTETEFKLLYKLLSYPGVIFTKQQLMDDIWGYDSESDYGTIKVYINRLRNKIGDCDSFDIVSVRGVGYKAVIKRVVYEEDNGLEELSEKNIIFESSPFFHKLFYDVKYRTLFFTRFSVIMNVLYGLLQIGYGAYYLALWYVTLGVYYILLIVMRTGLLRNVQAQQIGINLKSEYKKYLQTGILLLFMNLIVIGIVTMMFQEGRVFSYPGVLIYAMAAYAFYSLGLAVYGMVTYKKYNSPLLSATRAVNFAGALISILSLEIALLNQFGTNDPALFAERMVGITGLGITILVTIIGVHMIVKGKKGVSL